MSSIPEFDVHFTPVDPTVEPEKTEEQGRAVSAALEAITSQEREASTLEASRSLSPRLGEPAVKSAAAEGGVREYSIADGNRESFASDEAFAQSRKNCDSRAWKRNGQQLS